jgi:predicted PurR-regulated permease PerM
MKKFLRRLVAYCLSLVLFVMVMPMFAIQANAENSEGYQLNIQDYLNLQNDDELMEMLLRGVAELPEYNYSIKQDAIDTLKSIVHEIQSNGGTFLDATFNGLNVAAEFGFFDEYKINLTTFP